MSKWLVAIVGLAFVLRFWGICDYPAGFSADEVGQGYTAYSLLRTGKDEWGEALPIAPRSYGDYRAPLYTYLTIPFVAIFGLSEFAVRLPNVLIGTASVIVVYFLTKKILGNDQKLSLLAAFFLAISSWHIALSRGAFEPNLPVLLIPLGWLAFENGKSNRAWMVFSAFVFGLGLFSYYSARFVIPIFIFALLLVNRKFEKLFLGVFLPFLIIAFATMLTGGGTRSADVAIVNPTGGWQEVSDRRYEAVLLGLPDWVSRIFNNKLTYTLGKFVENYLAFYSPQFLFTNGAGEATYGMKPGVGVLYLVELPLILFGAVILAKNVKKYPYTLILLILLVFPIPAALSKGPGFPANRVALVMPFIQIVSVLGFMAIRNTFIKRAVLLVVFVLLVSFLESYFYQAPQANAESMSYGWREVMSEVSPIEPNYREIVVSRSLSEPQMFVAFYTRMDPYFVQEQSRDWLRYEDEGLLFVDQLGEYRLGKYTFRAINWGVDSEKEDTLFIGKPQDFPESVSPKVISYPNGTDALYIVEP